MVITQRKYLSIFFLLAFLFPPAVEAIHSFEHRNDSHCTEQFLIHFHAEEHHCNICDYSPAPSFSSSFHFEISDDEIISSDILLFHTEPVCENSKFSFSFRGPPIV